MVSAVIFDGFNFITMEYKMRVVLFFDECAVDCAGYYQPEEEATMEYPGYPGSFDLEDFTLVFDDGRKVHVDEFPAGMVRGEFWDTLESQCAEEIGVRAK